MTDGCKGATMQYTCNICGQQNELVESRLGRETPDCGGCGSTVRMRSIIGLLTRSLFGTLAPIEQLPTRPEIRGVGLSDWDEYARRLAERFDYTNTYYHQEPRLDITEVGDDQAATCDFVISTDVFEHVLSPVSRAFVGARKLLKPGGVLVLTVPYSLDAQTKEHFPELHDWRLEREGADWVLRNRRPDGSEDEFRSLIFHGGPGSTLEMRLFCRDDLVKHLNDAGFREVRIADELMPEIGVVWNHPWSLPIVARA